MQDINLLWLLFFESAWLISYSLTISNSAFELKYITYDFFHSFLSFLVMCIYDLSVAFEQAD